MNVTVDDQMKQHIMSHGASQPFTRSLINAAIRHATSVFEEFGCDDVEDNFFLEPMTRWV